VGSHKIDYAYITLRLHDLKRLFGRVVTMDVMRYCYDFSLFVIIELVLAFSTGQDNNRQQLNR
jgi:hypothetical protein